MKRNIYSMVLVSLLAMPGLASAADDTPIQGNVDIGVRGVNDDNAKLQEFRDVDDGGFGRLEVDAQRGSTYLDFEGTNPGLDDQSFRLRGGDYGNFSYKLKYDETPHNLTFDAKTYLSGVGTQNLSFNGAAPAPEANWSLFDYTIQRQEYGGEVEISLHSPYFVKAGFQRREQEGLKPLGTGSFSGETEIPEPVDYTTDDFTLQAGYRSKELHASLSGYLSSFKNDNKYLSWKNPFDATSDVNTLPPDNDYVKVAGDLSWRGLPLSSLLALRASHAKLDNNFSVSELNITAPAGLNRTTFDGDVTYDTASVALSSQPTRLLDTRVYYNYLDKDNDSSLIAYTGESNAIHIFDYQKDNAGIDVGYRLPWRTKIDIGYEYLDLDRHNREDAESTTDNSVYVQIKNSSLDFLTAKLRYTRLARDSDFGNGAAADPIARYVHRFDATDKSMDEVRLNLDVFPLEQLDCGFEYRFRKNDYDETQIGRTEDKRHELYADATWHAPDKTTLNGFVGYETMKTDASMRQFTASATGDITAAPTATDFNWTNERDDDFWTYGVSVNVPDVIDRLTLNVSWQYQESDGEVDFASQAGAADNIDQSDDYTKKQLEAKAIYAFSSKLDLTLGYLYERFDINDLQFVGYDYTTAASYLSGAYADQNYDANVGYVIVSYGF